VRAQNFFDFDMPELPEIHRFAQLICAFSKDESSLANVGEHGSILFAEDLKSSQRFAVPAFIYVTAVSRGKQLKLCFVDRNDNTVQSVVIGFGLTGVFKVIDDEADLPSGVRFGIKISRRRGALALVDTMKMANWRAAHEFDKDRSPDPMLESLEFQTHVKRAVERGLVKGDICELMLDQKLFNGIGNYLRAEILHRAQVWPFDDAVVVLNSFKGMLCVCLVYVE
jgi:endonuclease VIII-like 1